MFCPNCKDEFRAGFTRCARCDVELVEDLSRVEERPSLRETVPPPQPTRMADYCGFVSMADANHARGELRSRRIVTEIVVREPPGVDWDAPPRDEFWIRVDASRLAEVHALMEALDGGAGAGGSGGGSGETFECGDCGQTVNEAESFCPKCGVRFDE